ncbi:MAG TPA: hypothetical protein VL126_14135 [Bacteroidota bacterium]|nr:hypothetical protein [Bacteroidota bacterium]
MSLKSFHLLFIGASILLSLGCLFASAWTLIREPAGIHLAPVVLAAVIFAVLTAYAMRAARGFRRMGEGSENKTFP